jgi:hypothetical protein
MGSSRSFHVREMMDQAAVYRTLADMCERMASKLALEGIVEEDGDAVELALLALGRRPPPARQSAEPCPEPEPEPEPESEPEPVGHASLDFYDPPHSQEEPWEGFEMLPPRPQ